MERKILDSKYFRIKSNICIDKGTMNLVALFFGLFGIPNFITKRYLQGIVHLVLLFLIILGVLIFGSYFVSMPWGPILITISYVLVFFETKAYNQQVDRIKIHNINPVKFNTPQLEVDEAKNDNTDLIEKVDKSFSVSVYASATLSFFILLFGLFDIWVFIGALRQNYSGGAAGGVLFVFIAVAIMVPLFVGVCICQEKAAQFKISLLQFGRFTKKHKNLLRSARNLFLCAVAIVIIVASLFLYMCVA